MAFTEFGYGSDPELCNSISSAIYAFMRKHGKKPELMLLGYGTYIIMAITRSEAKLTMEWPTHFDGVTIVIDPAQEYRIEPSGLPTESVRDTAIRAKLDSLKTPS